MSDFLTGGFGPLSPLVPMPIDVPPDGGERPYPRRWQYPVGWNLPTGQPGAEGLKLATFPTLRRLADTYSVVRAMLNIRTNEMAGLDWDVGPTATAQDESKKDKGAKKDQKERSAQIVKWFNKVDSNYKGFLSWFQAALEDQYVIDAVSLHMLPPRVAGKGLFGSDLAQLELLNGETIRPLLDVRGATPRPPAPAYQQYIWGVPRADLMDVITGRDLDEMADRLEDANQDEPDDPDEEYAADQLLYLPRLRRSWTPYGFSAIEQALLPISIGLQRQGFLLDYFTEGTIPGVYVIAGDQYVTPAQQRQLQDTLNALAGDVAWKHRVIVLPPGSKTDPQKDMAWQEKVDQSIVEQVGMILHIQPHEVGMVPGGRSSGLGGKGMIEGQQDAATEQRTEPDRKWWKETLFDWVIQEVFHQEDLEWKWLNFEEEEDASSKADAQQKFISMGKTTIDEERIEDGLDPFNLPLTSTPWVLGGPGGVIPLDPTVPPPAPPAPPPGMGPELGPDGKPLPPKPGAPPFGAKPGVPGAKPSPFGGPPKPGAAPGRPFGGGTPPAAAPPASGRPAAPPAVSKAFGQAVQPPAEEVGPVNPDGTPVLYPDGTPAAYAPDGGIAEPPDGQLFTDDELDGLLDVTDEEVGALLQEDDDVPEPVPAEALPDQEPAATPTGTPPAKKAVAAPAVGPKKQQPEFRPIHGALNPAYTSSATHDDVHREVQLIRGRHEARVGAPVTATPVVGTFARNLARKVRAAIIALAVKKYGRVPSRDAADATYKQWNDRWLDKFLEAAKRELRAHDHVAHATGLAHERHLARMRVDQVARGQEQRSGVDARDPATPDRRVKKYAVKYNRRDPAVKDRRIGDRRSGAPVPDAQKYDSDEPRDDHGMWMGEGAGHDLGERVGSMIHMEGNHAHQDPVHESRRGPVAVHAHTGYNTRTVTRIPVRRGAFGGWEPVKRAESVADLVKGKIKYKGDLTDIVYRYLLRSYPADAVDWVNDKGGEWEYDPSVPLKDINMARRPGGRDPEKVAAIGKTLSDGASLDPIVLVDSGNPAGYDIADGWHRTLGAEDAGLDDVPAFIGHGFDGEGLKAPWGTEMQDASDSKKRAEVNELAVLRRFVRKGGLVENFRTDDLPADVMEELADEVTKMDRDEAFERARLRLDGIAFAPKYSPDEARVDPGGPGGGEWTSDGSSGSSGSDDKHPKDLFPKESIGDKQAGHTPVKPEMKLVSRDVKLGHGEVLHQPQELKYVCSKCGKGVYYRTDGTYHHEIQHSTEPGYQKGEGVEKDFSLTSPLSTGFVPFGLDQEPSPGDLRCEACGKPLTGGACPDGHAQKAATPDRLLLAAIDAELRRRGVDPEAT